MEAVRQCVAGPHLFEPYARFAGRGFRCTRCGLIISPIVLAWYNLGVEDEKLRQSHSQTQEAPNNAQTAIGNLLPGDDHASD
jgi:hypothetical protein